MKSGFSYVLLGLLLAAVLTTALPAYTYYGAHITAQSPWVTRIDIYNNGDSPEDFTLTIWNSQGQQVSSTEYPVGANGVTSLVMPAWADYVAAPGEIVIAAVEGTCTVVSSDARVRPKLSYRYGDSLSLCEFFMQDALAWEYVLPNTIQPQFVGTGIALMNPTDNALSVRLEAFRQGVRVGDTGTLQVAAHTKLVSISEGFWPGVGAGDFDMVRIRSDQAAFPTPMSITWDQLNDRHVFFNAAPTLLDSSRQPGDLYAEDSIVGSLVWAPAGTFTQGAPSGEACRWWDETPFSHTLTRNIAVMETEVTQAMWSALKAVQATLPANPSFFAGAAHPVENLTWYEAVLFANLLSVQQGLTRCYYKDAGFTQPVTASNYTSGSFYCNFAANGYRLPTEGEWEWSSRAGTTTPFWIAEPNYGEGNCDVCNSGLLPNLESAAVFCANDADATSEVATKAASPWNLYDTAGNVWEWCWDWYQVDYPTGSVTDYAGPASSSDRAIRGGCYMDTARYCRSAERGYRGPGDRGTALGFRLVRTAQ
jgi:formylglycine-generating enzyme required for sulfatase activity